MRGGTCELGIVVLAFTGPQERVAMRLDAHAFQTGLETESACDAVMQQGSVLVLELQHTVAVEADEMVVLGFIEEIGVVVGLVSPQIDFTQQPAFHQKGQGAVNSGSGDCAVEPAGFFQKFLGLEMLVCSESGFDDDIALFGAAQTLSGQMFVQALGNSFVHVRDSVAKPSSRRKAALSVSK